MTRQEKMVGLVALFHKDAHKDVRLFSIVAVMKWEDGGLSRREIDVEWSRHFGSYIYHESGFGGLDGPIEVDVIYWTEGEVSVKEMPCQLVSSRGKKPWHKDPGTIIIRKRNRPRKLAKLPKHIREPRWPGDSLHCEGLWAWLEQTAFQDEAVHCSTCRTYRPGGDLCQHCWWCDNTGWYSTVDERCSCKGNYIHKYPGDAKP